MRGGSKVRTEWGRCKAELSRRYAIGDGWINSTGHKNKRRFVLSLDLPEEIANKESAMRYVSSNKAAIERTCKAFGLSSYREMRGDAYRFGSFCIRLYLQSEQSS